MRIFSVGYLGISSRKTRNADADELIVSGPYRFVRNPIYLGNILIYLGFTVLSNVFFPLFPLMTFVFFVFVYYSIVLYEESGLSRRFDLKYQKYVLSVPRFFPRFHAQLQINSTQKFDAAMALQSEKTTLIVLVLAFSAIVIKNYTP
ncbi:isoprenylcysteine carboxylmethyltransferase family protein [bacterium]|nr:isoprenylcysteine carboxylmethyltransferase family protein [bacterium]